MQNSLIIQVILSTNSKIIYEETCDALSAKNRHIHKTNNFSLQ